MSDIDRSKRPGKRLTIDLFPERAAELDRISAELGREPGDLAKEYLEKEIEAEHGLRYGPYLRKYMYRA